MNELSLFSGYCGFTLGLRLAGLQVRTVGYVDNEPYIQKLIAQRIRNGFLDDAPIFGDVKLFLSEGYAASYQGLVDILTAGFPCQPHSTAGRRLGASDPRNLWPELAQCIGVVRPRSVLLENVPGLIDGANPYVGVVVGDLARIGYDARWGLVPAAAVGAPHLRWRWWCLAYPADDGRRARWRTAEQGGAHKAMGRREQPGADGEAGLVADADGERCGTPRTNDELRWTDASLRSSSHVADTAQQRQGTRRAEPPGSGDIDSTGWWAVEPVLGRVAHGTPDRVAQLRAAGNGIVPAVVARFLRQVLV